MAASCAGCLGSIERGDDFRLAGSEAFHASCLHLISQSVATKRELARIEANRQLLVERERVRDLEAELDETRIDCNKKNQRIATLEKAKASSDTARATIQGLRADLERMQVGRDTWAAECNRARRDLAQAQTDLAAARKELEALRSAAVAPAATAVNDADYSGAEARFKLLEFD